MVRIGSQGAAPHIREIYAFWDTIQYFSLLYFTLPFFMRSSTDSTGQPIWKPNGSKDAVWRKEVPFGLGVALLQSTVMVQNRQKNPTAPYGIFQPNEKHEIITFER